MRAYSGKDSSWFKAALRQRAGRIKAAGMTMEVSFNLVDEPIQARIDDAYRAKYRSSPYLAPMIGARARGATLKVMPRELRVEDRPSASPPSGGRRTPSGRVLTSV